MVPRPPGQLARLAAAAFAGLRLLRSRFYGPRGWSVVSTYWRLRLLALRYRRPLRAPRVTRVAGWRMTVWSYPPLAYRYAAKFLDLDYRFDSATPQPFVIDCGANIGLSVLFFKTLYPAAEIVAFEPDATSYRALEAVVRDNALAGVQLHRCAVGAVDGRAQFYSDPADPGSGRASLLVERTPTPSEMVDVVRLSRYIDRPVDLLKIDVEGAEMDVLRELAESGTLAMVREIIIEYHHHLRPGEDTLAALFRLLEDGGFGYGVAVPPGAPYAPGVFQDILVHAYGRSSALGP